MPNAVPSETATAYEYSRKVTRELEAAATNINNLKGLILLISKVQSIKSFEKDMEIGQRVSCICRWDAIWVVIM